MLGELSYQLPETAQTPELYCVLVSVVQTLPPWLWKSLACQDRAGLGRNELNVKYTAKASMSQHVPACASLCQRVPVSCS